MLPEKFCIKCIDPKDENWKKYIEWINSKNKFALLTGDTIGAYYCNDGYIMFPTFSNDQYTLISLEEFFEMKEEKEKEKEFIPISGETYLFDSAPESSLESGFIEIYVGKTKSGRYVSHEIDDEEELTSWDYCFAIPKEKFKEEPLELTLEQIAEKFNVSVENLKIKK